MWLGTNNQIKNKSILSSPFFFYYIANKFTTTILKWCGEDTIQGRPSPITQRHHSFSVHYHLLGCFFLKPQ
jgi:hypothetical protein